LKGYTIFSKNIILEDTITDFWNKYIGKNILKGIEILVILSDDLECLVCPNSRNYQSKGSLSYHYRFDHYHKTVDYIRENIITKNSDELRDLLQ